ncbi:MAG: hypothetical protein WCS96_00820 [Victivallales bacterium]
MKFVKILNVFLIAAVCGCSTTYYESRVVKKAREYVLEKMPELSEKARHCVKYGPPRLMQKRILVREGSEYSSKKDVVQTCVAWANPDQENTYIMVSGVSERRLDDWYPNRLVIKSGDDWETEEAVKGTGKNK